MELAFQGEVRDRKARKEMEGKGKKREVDEVMDNQEEDVKRVRVGGGRGVEVDVSVLDLRGVIEAVMEGLAVIPLESVNTAFEVGSLDTVTRMLTLAECETSNSRRPRGRCDGIG
jgi:hypothetical protein